MKRIAALLLVFCFIIWILPLGAFIKPSLQKLACDGQRAMCMCHIMLPKPSDKPMEPGIMLKAGPSANKENPSGGGANYFVSVKPAVILNLRSASFFENQYLAYKSPFLSSLEHVPKI